MSRLLCCLFGIVFSKTLKIKRQLFGLLSVNLWRENRNCTLVLAALVEVNDTICQSIQCIILTLSYILTWEVLVTTLANDDVTCDDALTTPDLNA